MQAVRTLEASTRNQHEPKEIADNTDFLPHTEIMGERAHLPDL